MINWWLELSWPGRGVIVALGPGVVNFCMAISDRRWSRGAESRLMQQNARNTLRTDLETIDAATSALPKLVMGLHGYPDIPAPPTECVALERRVAGAGDRTVDPELRRLLNEHTQRVVEYLSIWRTTAAAQTTNKVKPVRPGGAVSDAELRNLSTMTEGKTKLRHQRCEVHDAIQLLVNRLNDLDRAQRRHR
jgi:hypothetical protein